MSDPTVRILLVEDDVHDAELLQLLFENEGLRAEVERSKAGPVWNCTRSRGRGRLLPSAGLPVREP